MLIVNIEIPLLFATEIAPSEQVGAGLTLVDTLQVKATALGFNPPTGLIVIVEVADAPGLTEGGVKVPGETLKSGATTARLTAVEMLTLKLLSPLYAAEMLCVPAASEEVEKLAASPPLSAVLPSCVLPSRNITVPDGTPAMPGATVAVKLTA